MSQPPDRSRRTAASIVVAAPPAAVMAVIADFGRYPDWVDNIKSVEIVEPGVGGRADKVRFVLDAGIVADDYTLAYSWSDDEVSWWLVHGRTIKVMEGRYRLEREHGGTRVDYELAVDVALPLLPALKRKAERVIVETALHGLKARVET